MGTAIVILACSLFLVVQGYDWSDPDFNLMLRDDYEDNVSYLMNKHERMRRAVEGEGMVNGTADREVMEAPDNCPPRGPPGMRRACCGDKDNLKLHGEPLKQVKRMCFAEMRKARGMMTEEEAAIDVFDCDKVTKTKEELVCIMECVGKKKNMTDQRGDVMEDSVRMFVKNELATEEWQKMMVDAVLDKCFKNVTMAPMNTSMTTINTTITTKPDLSKDTAKEVDATTCNPSMLIFSYCLWREYQLSCPQDQTKTNPYCQRLRDRLTKNTMPKPDKQRRRPKQPDRE